MRESPRLVRFLVAVQRRPAISTLLAYAAILIAGLPMRIAQSDAVGIVYMTFATFAATAVAAVLARATSLWARIAVVGLAVGATLPIAYAAFALEKPWVLVLVGVAGALPHVTVAVTARVPALRGRVAAWVATFAAPALLAAAPAIDHELIPLLFCAWLLALQIAIVAVMDRGIRLPVLCLAATAWGCAGGWALLLVHLAETSGSTRFGPGIVVGLGATWLAGALLAAIARLGASFTAIPADHPVVADFGPTRAR